MEQAIATSGELKGAAGEIGGGKGGIITKCEPLSD